MGLHAPLIEMLVAEHSYKPVRGDVLFIGRQTAYVNEASLKMALGKYALSLPDDFSFEYDEQTRTAQEVEFRLLSDRCVMRALGVKRLQFLDVSAYEGADVIADLSLPIPQELVGRFDFIYDGSCLDNIFNPAVALQNMAAMLRPGGRLLLMESGSAFNNPYSMFSFGWFNDYFLLNRFSDIRGYIAGYTDSTTLCFGPWRLHCPPTTALSYGFVPSGMHAMIVMLAEKGPDSTTGEFPLQSQYRDDESNQRMEQALKRLSRDRPYFRGVSPALAPEFKYVGEVGQDLFEEFRAKLVKKVPRK